MAMHMQQNDGSLKIFVCSLAKDAYIRQIWDKQYPANIELVRQVFQNLSSVSSRERDEYIKKLNNKNINAFWTSVAELYFANYLVGKKYTLKLHPKLKSKSTRPEMKVTRSKKKSPHFYLEVKTFFQEGADRNSWKVLNDIVESAKKKIDNNLPYHISIYAKDKPHANLKYSRVVNKILKMVEDYKKRGKKRETHTSDIVVNDIRFTIWIRYIESDTLSFGMSPGGGSVNTADKIKNAIKKKSLKYGRLKSPFVLVLDTHDAIKFGRHQLENALFGLTVISWKINPLDGSPIENEPSVVSRDNSGIIKPHKLTRLSAVVYHDLRLFDTGNIHTIRVYHNPFAKYPLPREVFSEHPQYMPIETKKGGGYMKWINDKT